MKNGLTNIQRVEKQMMAKSLKTLSITKSAVALGMSRGAFLRRMDAYGFRRPGKGKSWRDKIDHKWRKTKAKK